MDYEVFTEVREQAETVLDLAAQYERDAKDWPEGPQEDAYWKMRDVLCAEVEYLADFLGLEVKEWRKVAA